MPSSSTAISERPPSRFLEEIPEQYVNLVTTHERPARRSFGSSRAPVAPSGRTMDYSYSQVTDASEADFGASNGGLAPGTKVRHATFGIGIVRRSEGRGDQEKLMVQFARAGMKKLIRKFANLELVDGTFDDEGVAGPSGPAPHYSR